MYHGKKPKEFKKRFEPMKLKEENMENSPMHCGRNWFLGNINIQETKHKTRHMKIELNVKFLDKKFKMQIYHRPWKRHKLLLLQKASVWEPGCGFSPTYHNPQPFPHGSTMQTTLKIKLI